MNKCVKLISINCSSKKADYVNLNLFQFDEVYNSFVLIRLYKYINRNDNNFFKEKSRTDSITHPYVTRSASSGNYHIPQINLSIIYKSFYYNAVKLWNEIPPSIKNLNSLIKFRKHLKSFLLNKSS